VEEQFYKLIWLIDTHYRAMLLADRYVEQFGTFRTFTVPESLIRGESACFEDEDGVLVERNAALLEDILPCDPHCVGICCVAAGVYCSQLSFMAETGMSRLLDVKDRTGGLSTDRPGQRNMHVWLAPTPIRVHRDCAAAVLDKRLSVGTNGATVAKLDVLQALNTCERYLDLVPSEASPLWIPS